MLYFNTIKVHWTHVLRIKKLCKEGYSTNELAQMYKVPHHVISRYTRTLNKPERV